MNDAAQPVKQQEEEKALEILVAEDSSVTQDLLKLVLSQKGYNVHIVTDGEEARTSLLQGRFDIALLDFHMPKMSGLKVVSEFDRQRGRRKRPIFIAITGDVEGLLSNEENCELFDKVLPKPLNIENICQIIEETQQWSDDAGPEVAQGDAPGDSVVQRAGKTGNWLDQLDYNLLHWPRDFNLKHLSARALQASLSGDMFDGIAIDEAAAFEELAPIWRTKGLHLLPVIDLHGSLGAAADLNAAVLNNQDAVRVAGVLDEMREKKDALHDDLLSTDELGGKLLSAIFVRGGKLKPHYAPQTNRAVAYNLIMPASIMQPELLKLETDGFFSGEFFDRLHVCTNCSSSRLTVREECANCRSPHLTEESFLHHFRCAFQGPESDFRRSDDLVCPKCSRDLNHYGHDYDRPGISITCHACGHSSSETAVGFVCLDCHSHFDGDAINTRDIFAYSLTDKALAYLKAGDAYLGYTQKTLKFADFPLDIVVALNDAAKDYNDKGDAFSIVSIAYKHEQELVS